MTILYKTIDYNFDISPLVDIAEDNTLEPYWKLLLQGPKYEPLRKTMASTNSYLSNLKFRDIPQNYIDLQIFAECEEIFAKIPDFDREHIYSIAQIFKVSGPLPPHQDERSCAFSIPLMGVDTPLQWYDNNNNLIEEYTYNSPILFNTIHKHGSTLNSGQRIFFQIGFKQSIQEVIPLLSI